MVGIISGSETKVKNQNFNFKNLILDGGVRFKAVVQEIGIRYGDERRRGEVTSEPDGQKQKIKYKYGGPLFVRYNITLL